MANSGPSLSSPSGILPEGLSSGWAETIVGNAVDHVVTHLAVSLTQLAMHMTQSTAVDRAVPKARSASHLIFLTIA